MYFDSSIKNGTGQDLDSLRIKFAAHPEDRESAVRLAMQYADKGWLNEAIEVYRKIVDDNETDYAILLEYGNVCFRKQEIDDAARIFRKLTVLKPDRVEGWNNLGIILHVRNEDDSAMESFEKVLELEPDNSGALLNLGNCHSRKGNIAKSIELFKKAVALKPDFADGWFNLGNSFCSGKDYSHALEAYKKAVKYQREFPSALKNMGFVCEQTGDFDSALQYYNEALSYSRGDASLYVNIANVYVMKKKYDEARNNYLLSVKLSPKELSGWMGLRHIALLRGDIESYTKATLAVLSRLEQKAVAESLMILRELRHFRETDEIICRVDDLDLKGDDIDAERLLAYQRTDSYPGKIIALHKKLKSLPAPSEHIISCLACYAFDIKEYAAAISYLESVNSIGIHANILLWRSYIALKEWGRAEHLIREYLDKHEDCFDAWYFLAKVKVSNNDGRTAGKYLVKAMENGFSEMELIENDPDMKSIWESLQKISGKINS
jgi:tetratricopeptide (TPR) repeat protein